MIVNNFNLSLCACTYKHTCVLYTNRARKKHFFTYIPCILIISKFYLPTDAKLNCLKNNLTIHIKIDINPLNDELNPICHLLVLLGDLTFMGPCIVSIFQYIPKKMQRYTVYLYLETALHPSGGTSTHHQERIQLYLQHLVFVTPLLLSAAIVEELEPV